MGSGKQWMSWITMEDAVRSLVLAVENGEVRGPLNLATPQPCTNSEFTKVLASVLHRPALFPAPAFALRLALGEMTDALLLSSQRVLPAKLLRHGFQFRHPSLKVALNAIFS